MQKDFIEDLVNAMEGGYSVGHQSLVYAVCEKHNEEELDWNDALALVQEHGAHIEECEECGWVVDDIFDDEGRCSHCAEYA